jgi:hypothetical protein
MTTTLTRQATRSVPATAWAAALLLPVGPLAIAVLRLVLPYYTRSTTAGMVAAVDAHPGRQSAVLWLAYVGVLALVPGLYVVAGVCRSAAPLLTAWAMGLAVPGYLSLPMMLGADDLLWSTHKAGLSTTDSVAVVDAAHPAVGVALGVFVLGHVAGTVLLGLALLRSGRIPAWAAWAVAVSQPLHFVATVFLGSPQVDFVAWCLTALGLAMVARVVVREPVEP